MTLGLKCAIAGAALVLAGAGCVSENTGTSGSGGGGQGVQIDQLTNRLRVQINGQLFTEYYFKDVPRPYCYPVIGPDESPMTRNWPLKTVPDEEHDHPHHRSLWFAHGAVNGLDFWSEEKNFGKIVHQTFSLIQSGPSLGIIRSSNLWVSADGLVICSDERELRIHNPGKANERVMDFKITMHALNGPVTFGDTKEGTMAIRLAETMRLKGKVAGGHIVNSEGVRDDQTWGKRADWCDYYGPVAGHTVGLAIFDHPSNPRHPTWWHVRDYGLFAANPFGVHDFEKLSNKSAGNLALEAGQSLTFQYRFYFHEGDQHDAHVADRYREYTAEKAHGH